VGKFDKLSWDELRERMTAVAGGASYHSFSESEVSEIMAEALVRVIERLEVPKPKRRTSKPPKESP
jgi:hypothetical protein